MIETQIVQLLRTLVSGGAYPDVADGTAVLPYATYQQVGGKPIRYLSGIADKKIARFQINVWSKTRAEATTLIRQIEDQMILQLNATAEGGAISTYDEISKLRGAMQDFSVTF